MSRILPRRQRGTTLTEAMVALGLAAGGLYAALPSLRDMIRSQALAAASQEMLDDLYLARSEALKRNRRVALCKSPDQQRCTAAGGWEQGWIVFHDDNANGIADPGEERLAHHAALAPNLRLRGNQSVANYVSYTAVGTSKLTGGGFQAGTLTVCELSVVATRARQLVVNAVGRPRVQQVTIDACDWTGSPPSLPP